jgi:hypothetical protein
VSNTNISTLSSGGQNSTFIFASTSDKAEISVSLSNVNVENITSSTITKGGLVYVGNSNLSVSLSAVIVVSCSLRYVFV